MDWGRNILDSFQSANFAKKTTSIGNVLSKFTYYNLSPTRNIFIFTITKEQIHIQIRNAKLKEKVLLKSLTVTLSGHN